MDADLMKKILTRFRRDELHDVIQKWGHLPPDSTAFISLRTDGIRKAKKTLVADIVRECTRKRVSQAALEELDLLYAQSHSRNRLWSVYQIQRSDTSTHKSYAPNTFRDGIKAQLKNYFDTAVCVLPKDDAYWLRISLKDVGPREATSVGYVIYHPQADYIIAANIQKALSKYIFQAFVTVTNGTRATDIQLQGRCVKSLAQLSIGRDRQGPYSRLALNQLDGTALTSKSKKRKREDDDPDDWVLQVVNENRDEKRRRESKIEETFGPNELPTLENVTFQCQTEFGGLEHAPAMAEHSREIFQCTVKFEGPSVLQGIRNLAKAGLADLPMRKHLTTIQHNARSKFLIHRKQQSAHAKTQG